MALALTAHGWAMAAGAGFTPIGAKSDPYPNVVAVVTIPGCPGAIAKRGRELSAQLKSRGIPVQETSSLGFQFTDMEAMKRTQTILSGEGNPVIVHGKIKMNPSLEDIIAEYQNTAQPAGTVVEVVTFK